MYIKEIKLHSALEYVKDSDSLETVRKELLMDHTSAQIVVDAKNNISGIITIRDLLKVENNDFTKLSAKDICNDVLLSVSEYELISKAAMLMVHNHCHHLIVIDDKEEKIKGILSSIDLINYYAENESNIMKETSKDLTFS